jgi:hypothetical protein
MQGGEIFCCGFNNGYEYPELAPYFRYPSHARLVVSAAGREWIETTEVPPSKASHTYCPNCAVATVAEIAITSGVKVPPEKIEMAKQIYGINNMIAAYSVIMAK